MEEKLADDGVEVKAYFTLNFFLKNGFNLVKFDLERLGTAARGGSEKISWRRREAR